MSIYSIALLSNVIILRNSLISLSLTISTSSSRFSFAHQFPELTNKEKLSGLPVLELLTEIQLMIDSFTRAASNSNCNFSFK